MLFKGVAHPRTEPGREIVTDQCHFVFASGELRSGLGSFSLPP
jgi:hypothetical protein